MKDVEQISPEVAFVKRFALLNGKTRTKSQVLNFIKALQKAIAEGRIRKTSKHAKVIDEIQKILVRRYNTMKMETDFKFRYEDEIRYLKVANAEYLLHSVRFIKRYLNMLGRDVTKEQVKSFHIQIEHAIEKGFVSAKDKYMKHIRFILKSLQGFIKSSGHKALTVSESELNGLEGVLNACGCKSHALNGLKDVEPETEPEEDSKNDGVMTVDEVRQSTFTPVPITGDWLRLIGKFCLPTQFFVYGLGGSGKTSWVLLFTQYLSTLGYKILYVAGEQFNTPSFTELLNRLNIRAGDNFKIVEEINILNPKDFDFVVLDSKDFLEVDVNKFLRLREKYPQQSFIVLSQSTKTGKFTGSERWRNIVDVMVLAEQGIIRTGHDKNRWGGAGEMEVF